MSCAAASLLSLILYASFFSFSYAIGDAAPALLWFEHYCHSAYISTMRAHAALRVDIMSSLRCDRGRLSSSRYKLSKRPTLIIGLLAFNTLYILPIDYSLALDSRFVTYCFGIGLFEDIFPAFIGCQRLMCHFTCALRFTNIRRLSASHVSDIRLPPPQMVLRRA